MENAKTLKFQQRNSAIGLHLLQTK